MTDAWEVQDAAGHGGLELRLRSRRTMAARRRARGEAQVVSAKALDLWQLHRFDAAVDLVTSGPEGIDEVKRYTSRLSAPEYVERFDGSEQLIGISVTPLVRAPSVRAVSRRVPDHSRSPAVI